MAYDEDKLLNWADTHQQLDNDSQGFAGKTVDWFAKGVPLAVASGLVSMYNTGVSLGNVLGANAEKIDLGAEAAAFDDDYGKYYERHKEGIDLGGFLATSLAPGVGGIKALKMLQGGVAGANSANALGLIKNTNNVFGLFRNAELKYTEKALESIRGTANVVSETFDTNKILAIAAGVGDQALQGAAFQGAVLLTMNQSPILSKPDEDYVTSLVRNSHEILTAAGIQGVLGGGLGALGIAGKIKGAAYERDIKLFPSKHPTYLGDTFIDPGTAWSIDYAHWRNTVEGFDDLRAKGLVDDKQIIAQDTTVEHQGRNLKERLTTELLGEENGKHVNDLLWDLILNSEKPAETAHLLATTATKMSRVTLEMQPEEESAMKVWTAKGPLSPTHAKNILARGKVVPGQYENPTATDLLEWKADGHELWRDTSDQLHVLEISDYATKQLARTPKRKIFDTIVKIAGDNKGEVTEFAFPVVGDLGKDITLSKQGNLLIDGNPLQGMPLAFNPKTSAPIFSSAFFTKMGMHELPSSEGTLALSDSDLPYLEMLVKKGFSGHVTFDVKPQELSSFTKKVPVNETPDMRKMGVISQEMGPQALKEFTDLKAGMLRDGWWENYADQTMREQLSAKLSQTNTVTMTAPAKDGAFFNSDIMSIKDILKQVKMDARQDMMNLGHDFGRIARELNVTQEFAESGNGDGFMLSALEDHTKPLHVAINYDTTVFDKLKLSKFHVQGMENLFQYVKIAYQHNQTMAADILGPAYNRLPNTKGTLFDITTTAPASTMTQSSSGNYGSFYSFMQEAGKVANTVKRERTQAVFQALEGYTNALKADRDGLTEFNVVVNKVRASAEKMDIIPDTGMGGQGGFLVPKSLIKEVTQEQGSLGDMIQAGLDSGDVYKIKSQAAFDYLDATKKVTGARATDWNKIFSARGMEQTYDVDSLYIPPINTRKYPFVAFVKERMDLGTGDMKESGVLVGATAKELEAKVNHMKAIYGDTFEFKTLSDIESYKIAKGEYEEGPMMGRSMADSAMKKEGLFYEFAPRIDEEILDDFSRWHYVQERNIVHNAIELKYAQEFAELRAMGTSHEEFASSKVGEKNKRMTANNNPYLRYIQTGLDINNFDQYESIWGKVNGLAENAFKKMFSVWDTVYKQAARGEKDWLTANKEMESYGFRAPYKDVIEDVMMPRVEKDRNLQVLVAKANGAVSTLTLGLDFFNSVVNVLSFPIMATAEMSNILKNLSDPSKVGALADITKVKVPEGNYSIPTPMKLLFNSIRRLFSEQGKDLTKLYEGIGAIVNPTEQYMNVVAASRLTEKAIKGAEPFKYWVEQLNEHASNLAGIGKTLTGYNKAEFLVRFLAADMAKQVVDIAGVEASHQSSYINAFVNRVHGNYLASQRPHLFQGAVGQAISLFQTYQFNIMQNMTRYIQTGDTSAAKVMLAMQNTLFGVQGNPGFYILNKSIGEADKEHRDITTGTKQILGDEVSKWVLYGLGSNTIRASLYNRGDLTPRYATIVPTNLMDVPGIAIPYKAINSFVQAASNISKGGDVTNSLLDGVAHFGANRPLSGLAQLAQGYRTTSKGDMMAAYADITGWTVAAKLMGGEELNRQIQFDNYYRTLGYKKYDQDLVNSLGEAVKTTMGKGQHPSQAQVQDFMRAYVNAGGNPQGFNRFMINAYKGANQSQMNTLAKQVNTRAGRAMSTSLGGDNLPDYHNKPANVGLVPGSPEPDLGF